MKRIYPVTLMLAISGIFLLNGVATAQTTFQDIVAPNPSEYAMYQIKLTWTGVQTGDMPSLLVIGSARQPDISEFESHQTLDVAYGNDEGPPLIVSLSSSSIDSFIQGISRRGNLQIPGGHDEPYISLMIMRGLPPFEIVFEHLHSGVEAFELLALLEAAVRSESPSTREDIGRFRNFTIGPISTF